MRSWVLNGLYLALTSPLAFAADLECYNFGHFGAGELIGDKFHAQAQLTSLNNVQLVTAVGTQPSLWVSNGATNGCIKETGSMGFVDPNVGNRRDLQIKGFQLTFDRSTDRVVFNTADLGDWDAARILRQGGEGVTTLSAFNKAGELIAYSEYVISTFGSSQDGCTQEELSLYSVGIVKVVVRFFSRNKITKEVINDFAPDPNFGVLEICWPGAQSQIDVDYDGQVGLEVTPSSSIPAEGGFFEVWLTGSPVGLVTVDLGSANCPGWTLSKCRLYFDSQNWEQKQKVYVLAEPGSGTCTVGATATAPNDSDYDGLTKTGGLHLASANVATAKCTAWGDPHFTSFDGKKFNFQGRLHYNYVVDPDGDLVIQTKQVDCRRAACNSELAVKFKSSIVFVRTGVGALVTIHRVGQLSDGLSVKSIERGRGYLFKTATGVTVKVVSGFSRMRQAYILKYLTITAPGSYSRRVTGLCGNFDGNKGNDGGSMSYKVTGQDNLWNYPNIRYPLDYTTDYKPLVCLPDQDENDDRDDDDILDDIKDDPSGPGESGGDSDEPHDDGSWQDPSQETEANEKCKLYAEACAGAGVDVTEEIANCIYDVRITGDLGTIQVALEEMKELCQIDPPDECPDNCNFRGTCAEGVCVCEEGFKGLACASPDIPPCVSSVFPAISKAGDRIVLEVTGVEADASIMCQFLESGMSTQATALSSSLFACTIPSGLNSRLSEKVSISGSECHIALSLARVPTHTTLHVCDKNAVFVCTPEPLPNTAHCRVTTDDGRTMTELPSIIDLVGAKVDGVIYAKNLAGLYVRSADYGSTWVIATEIEEVRSEFTVLPKTLPFAEASESELQQCRNPDAAVIVPTVVFTRERMFQCANDGTDVCLAFDTTSKDKCHWDLLPVVSLYGLGADGYVYGLTKFGETLRSIDGDNWEAGIYDPGTVAVLNHFNIANTYIDGPVSCTAASCSLKTDSHFKFTFRQDQVVISEEGNSRECARPWKTCPCKAEV